LEVDSVRYDLCLVFTVCWFYYFNIHGGIPSDYDG